MLDATWSRSWTRTSWTSPQQRNSAARRSARVKVAVWGSTGTTTSSSTSTPSVTGSSGSATAAHWQWVAASHRMTSTGSTAALTACATARSRADRSWCSTSSMRPSSPRGVEVLTGPAPSRWWWYYSVWSMSSCEHNSTNLIPVIQDVWLQAVKGQFLCYFSLLLNCFLVISYSFFIKDIFNSV